MKARPTIYRGVHMRSRLEAAFAAWLDAQSLAWEYEPACYGDQDGQYLPDFRIPATYAFGERRRLYVEVKPGREGLDVWAELDAMRPIWSSEPDAMLAVCAVHDDAYWRFPLAWQPEGADGREECTRAVWVRCEFCSSTGVEDVRRMADPFEPTDCPRSCPEPALETRSPWASPQYAAAFYMRSGGY